MASADGPGGPEPKADDSPLDQTMELQLFESLVHHLIEKGVLTKNDALSVVQTVAEVKRGQRETAGADSAVAATELIVLERLYASFELVSGHRVPQRLDSGKILQLRPPIHGDNPRFPNDD